MMAAPRWHRGQLRGIMPTPSRPSPGPSRPSTAKCNQNVIDLKVYDLTMGSGTASSSAAEVPRHQLGWRMAVLPFRSPGAPVGSRIALGMAEEISAAQIGRAHV